MVSPFAVVATPRSSHLPEARSSRNTRPFSVSSIHTLPSTFMWVGVTMLVWLVMPCHSFGSG